METTFSLWYIVIVDTRFVYGYTLQGLGFLSFRFWDSKFWQQFYHSSGHLYPMNYSSSLVGRIMTFSELQFFLIPLSFHIPTVLVCQFSFFALCTLCDFPQFNYRNAVILFSLWVWHMVKLCYFFLCKTDIFYKRGVVFIDFLKKVTHLQLFQCI